MSALPSAAHAQSYDGCIAATGQPVVSIASMAINDIAMATMQGGQPVIYYNPTVVASASPQVRRFFYYHECAHHVLGHTLGHMPFGHEQQADCWAIRTLVRRGEFSDADVTNVQSALWMYARGDWTHLPGPQRAINLRACLGVGRTPRTLGDMTGGAVAPQPRPCRQETRWVTETVPVMQPTPQQVPCQHCGLTPWGYRCMHPFDVVNVPMQTMVTRQVPVTREVCE